MRKDITRAASCVLIVREIFTKNAGSPLRSANNQLTVFSFSFFKMYSSATALTLLSSAFLGKALHHLFFHLIHTLNLFLSEKGGVFFVILLTNSKQFLAHFKAFLHLLLRLFL